MTELALKPSSIPINKNNNVNSTLETFEKTLTEELIFGICSPIGSLKERVIEKLKEKLETEYLYDVRMIKLSEFIDKYEFTKEDEKEIAEPPEGSKVFKKYF